MEAQCFLDRSIDRFSSFKDDSQCNTFIQRQPQWDCFNPSSSQGVKLSKDKCVLSDHYGLLEFGLINAQTGVLCLYCK